MITNSKYELDKEEEALLDEILNANHIDPDDIVSMMQIISHRISSNFNDVVIKGRSEANDTLLRLHMKMSMIFAEIVAKEQKKEQGRLDFDDIMNMIQFTEDNNDHPINVIISYYVPTDEEHPITKTLSDLHNADELLNGLNKIKADEKEQTPENDTIYIYAFYVSYCKKDEDYMYDTVIPTILDANRHLNGIVGNDINIAEEMVLDFGTEEHETDYDFEKVNDFVYGLLHSGYRLDFPVFVADTDHHNRISIANYLCMDDLEYSSYKFIGLATSSMPVYSTNIEGMLHGGGYDEDE